MLSQLLSLAMILPSDVGALQGSRLLPNGQQAIAQIANIRAATVQTLQYTAYPVTPGIPSDSTIMNFTFPPHTLAAGNQVRFYAYGTVTDAIGKSFSPSLYVTQSGASNVVGILYATPGGAGMGWTVDAVVTISQPSVLSPASSRGAIAQSSSLGVGGIIHQQVRTAALTVDQDIAVIDPTVTKFDNNAPVDLSIQINTGNSVTFEVIGGWVEVL